ncbi:MAG TPA: prepilin peptidase, partial [Brevundimonas sp.]|nr:prepilin peptidase [Brevundimonas sp.]
MNPVIAAAVMGGLGLVFGSFIAAASVRLPRDEDIVMARSRCRGCDQPLRPWELVPLVSWLALRGRCARCDTRISRR